MINIKNILRVLLIALFVCVYSENVTAQDPSPTTGIGGASSNTGNFCSTDLGIFTELVTTGREIFNKLRDLIYVVAGFGIIAVAVGGFFGNLNWKWLGAIVISLVVIATAGEVVVLITGCDEFDDELITNTLVNPADATNEDTDEGTGQDGSGS